MRQQLQDLFTKTYTTVCNATQGILPRKMKKLKRKSSL